MQTSTSFSGMLFPDAAHLEYFDTWMQSAILTAIGDIKEKRGKRKYKQLWDLEFYDVERNCFYISIQTF